MYLREYMRKQNRTQHGFTNFDSMDVQKQIPMPPLGMNVAILKVAVSFNVKTLT